MTKPKNDWEEALLRASQEGYQRGSMDSEKKLGEVVDKLIEMQTVVKRHLEAPQLSHKTHLQIVEDVAERLVKLVGP